MAPAVLRNTVLNISKVPNQFYQTTKPTPDIRKSEFLKIFEAELEKGATMEIRFYKAEEYEDIIGEHFAIYDPKHNETWLYEYDGTEDARKEYTDRELVELIKNGYVFVLKEVRR